jgi:hypothetical protein
LNSVLCNGLKGGDRNHTGNTIEGSQLSDQLSQTTVDSFECLAFDLLRFLEVSFSAATIGGDIPPASP